MNHHTYTYCLLQYHHSQVLGEILNIGALVYFPHHKILNFIYPEKLIRLRLAYPNTPEKAIKSYFRFFDDRVSDLNKNTELFTDYDLAYSLNKFIDNEFLSPDSSAIKFSESKKGIFYGEDLKKISNQIYNLYFSVFEQHNGNTHKIDEVVLLKNYKKLLKEYLPSDLSLERKVKFDYTIEPKAGTTFKFDVAWKEDNETHLVKPISFDLSKRESILSKSYRYFGQFYDLQSYAKEKQLLFDVILAKPKSPQLFKIYDNALSLLSQPERVNIIELKDLSNYTKETITESVIY